MPALGSGSSASNAQCCATGSTADVVSLPKTSPKQTHHASAGPDPDPNHAAAAAVKPSAAQPSSSALPSTSATWPLAPSACTRTKQDVGLNTQHLNASSTQLSTSIVRPHVDQYHGPSSSQHHQTDTQNLPTLVLPVRTEVVGLVGEGLANAVFALSLPLTGMPAEARSTFRGEFGGFLMFFTILG